MGLRRGFWLEPALRFPHPGFHVRDAAGAPPAAAIPPDAAALQLPDMACLMADLRRRLEGLGLQVATAPRPQQPADVPRAVEVAPRPPQPTDPDVA